MKRTSYFIVKVIKISNIVRQTRSAMIGYQAIMHLWMCGAGAWHGILPFFIVFFVNIFLSFYFFVKTDVCII